MGRDPVSGHPGARDRRPRDGRGQRRHEVQGRRRGGRRLPRGFVPHLRLLPGGTRELLHQRFRRHLHGRRQAHRRPHVRRLYHRHHRGAGFRAAHAGQPRPRGGRPAAVRGHHDLLTAPPLEGGTRSEGRRRGTRRARPHGRQDCRGDGRRGDRLHDVSGQGRRGARPGRPRRGDQQGRGADAEVRRPARLHPEHRGRVARPRSVHQLPQARWHAAAWWACRPRRTRRRT